MGETTQTTVSVTMPQVNVNDEEVTLLGWYVEDGGTVAADEPLCEVETSKAVGDVPAPAGGVVRHAKAVGDAVAVGEVFAYIGPCVEAVDQYAATQAASQRSAIAQAENHDTAAAGVPAAGGGNGPVEATLGAIELARRYSIDLQKVASAGRVRRVDVERFIAERGLREVEQTGAATRTGQAAVPPALRDIVEDAGALSDHDWAIADHLARTQAQVVAANVVMDVAVERALRWIEAKRQAGMMTGLIPVLLRAGAAAAAADPRIGSFRLGRQVYRYREVNIAFAAKGRQGQLMTPVVRGVDGLSLDDLAGEVARLSMSVFRGKADQADLMGGCLTVSLLNDHPVRFHVGLQNAYQSAILTSGAVRNELQLRGGRVVEVPMLTLSLTYDHGLMDGHQAAAALAAAGQSIEQLAE